MCRVGFVVYYRINIVELDKFIRLRYGAGGGRNMEMVKRIVCDDSGQGLVEYAFILMLVALVVIAALTAIGESLPPIFENVNEGLEVR